MDNKEESTDDIGTDNIGANPSQPGTYITDIKKASEVGYSSKTQREEAARNRQIAGVVEEIGELSLGDDDEAYDERMEGLESKAHDLDSMYSTGEKYEEGVGENAFGKLSDFRIAGKVAEKAKAIVGELNQQAEISDAEAERIEKIAETLYDNPPSSDFLKDYGLSTIPDAQEVIEFEREIEHLGTIDELAGQSLAYKLEDAVRYSEMSADEQERTRKEFKEEGMNIRLSVLEVFADFARSDSNTEEFNAYRLLEADDATTIGELRNFCTNVVDRQKTEAKKESARLRQIIDALSDGSAHTYKSS